MGAALAGVTDLRVTGERNEREREEESWYELSEAPTSLGALYRSIVSRTWSAGI